MVIPEQEMCVRPVRCLRPLAAAVGLVLLVHGESVSQSPDRRTADSACLAAAALGAAHDPWLPLVVGNLRGPPSGTAWYTAIDPELLAGVEDREPVRAAEENYYEFQAYHYLLLGARFSSAADLASRSRRDLTAAHLLEEPAKYRGALVHIEGRLKRLRLFDASRLARERGVRALYEGWIFPHGSFSTPCCAIASENSDGIPIGESLEVPAAFDGYFLKVYRYKAGDGWRDAPLLIGRSPVRLTLAHGPSVLGTDSDPVWPMVALVGTVIVFLVGAACWYRREDRRVRAALGSTCRPAIAELACGGDR